MKYSRRQMLQNLTAAAAVGWSFRASASSSATGHGVRVDVFDAALHDIIDVDQSFEVLGTGYGWLEGPAWDRVRNRLYFSDVPGNQAYIWSEGAGIESFLNPSGIARESAAGFREPGTNGLLMGKNGKLLLCNHGKRAVEEMDIDTLQRSSLVSSYHGKHFNSPNDLIEAANGDIYFTDPPYGLAELNNSPLKEMTANGVYRLAKSGQVTRLLDDMTFPNGIALSLDEKFLFISQSDPDAPVIRRIGLHGNTEDEIWFDAKPYMSDGPGLPDGMALAASGHLFATGPGGVWVFNPSGKPLGRINPGRAVANCAFGEDGRTLFLTAHDRLIRARSKVRGAAWV